MESEKVKTKRGSPVFLIFYFPLFTSHVSLLRRTPPACASHADRLEDPSGRLRACFFSILLEHSLQFSRDLLGFKEIGRIFDGKAAALTSGRTHHELLLIQGGDAPAPPQGLRRGLYHIGIKIGDSLHDLRIAKNELERAGVSITGMSDHTVTQSLYLRDPDGNDVELYVDVDESRWENNPAAVLSPIKPLRL